MKRLFIALAAAAAALFATPALAQTNDGFTGVRAELQAGVDDVRNISNSNDINYGAAVGVDVPLGDRFTIGVEGTAANVFDNDERVLGAGARLGFAATPATLLYAGAGYENFRDADRLLDRNLDGLRISGGVEQRLGANSFVKVEGRYADLDQNSRRFAGLIGVGIRF